MPTTINKGQLPDGSPFWTSTRGMSTSSKAWEDEKPEGKIPRAIQDTGEGLGAVFMILLVIGLIIGAIYLMITNPSAALGIAVVKIFLLILFFARGT